MEMSQVGFSAHYSSQQVRSSALYASTRSRRTPPPSLTRGLLRDTFQPRWRKSGMNQPPRVPVRWSVEGLKQINAVGLATE